MRLRRWAARAAGVARLPVSALVLFGASLQVDCSATSTERVGGASGASAGVAAQNGGASGGGDGGASASGGGGNGVTGGSAGFAGSGGVAGAPPDPVELVTQIGGGKDAFIVLADGDPVPVIMGVQGGYHIWTSVRIHDPTLKVVAVSLTSRFEDTGALVGQPSKEAAVFDDAGDGWRVNLGMRSFIDAPAPVKGKRVTLRVEFAAADGRYGSDERTIVPQ